MTERKGHITRQGFSRVRKVLCQAVWSRLRVDPAARGSHARLTRGQPKRRKTATVAMMRQLAVWMWHTGRDAQEEAGVFGSAGERSGRGSGAAAG